MAGARAIVVGPGGLTLVQRLARRGVPVAVVAFPSQRWIARTRFAEGHLPGRLPAGRDRWLSTLAELARRGDGVLISGSDRAVEFLATDRDQIPARLTSFESPRSAHLRLMNKASLYDLAGSADVRSPWTMRISSAAELHVAAENAMYPCIVKPVLAHEWRRAFDEHRVLLAHDAGELVRLAGKGLRAGLELLASEYVPGPETSLENAVVLRRADGSFPLAFGVRKLRQYPPDFGAGSLHEVASVPETMVLAERLLAAVEFTGVATVETKLHSETGERVLIDVNARLTQPFGLGDAAGIDASWRLYATLAGVPLPPQPQPRLGVRNVVPTLEPRAAWTHLRNGGGLRSLVGGYRGVRDFSGISARDPLPLASVVWQQIRLALRYLRRRLGQGRSG